MHEIHENSQVRNPLVLKSSEILLQVRVHEKTYLSILVNSAGKPPSTSPTSLACKSGKSCECTGRSKSGKRVSLHIRVEKSCKEGFLLQVKFHLT